MSRTHPTRLAIGVLLAAGALALPAAASASFSVETPDRLPEGNKGLREAITKVHVACGENEEGNCTFTVGFAAGTAIGFADFGFDPPRSVTLGPGSDTDIDMLAEIVGDKVPEPDETYNVKVTEESPSGTTERTVEAGTIINDDGPMPRDNIKIKKLGKAKAPVNAPESMVERTPWGGPDDSSVGANCVTQPTQGWSKAFGAWGYYIPGCVVKVPCPEGKFCIARSESIIESTGDARVTLNSRLRVDPGNGTPPWKHDASCDNREQCTANDESILIEGGGYAELTCNGVQKLKGEDAGVTCGLDLEFQDDV